MCCSEGLLFIISHLCLPSISQWKGKMSSVCDDTVHFFKDFFHLLFPQFWTLWTTWQLSRQSYCYGSVFSPNGILFLNSVRSGKHLAQSGLLLCSRVKCHLTPQFLPYFHHSYCASSTVLEIYPIFIASLWWGHKRSTMTILGSNSPAITCFIFVITCVNY